MRGQSRAIYRLAGEEDVHAIDDPDMAKKEISSVQEVVDLTTCDRVSATDDDLHGDAGQWVRRARVRRSHGLREEEAGRYSEPGSVERNAGRDAKGAGVV